MSCFFNPNFRDESRSLSPSEDELLQLLLLLLRRCSTVFGFLSFVAFENDGDDMVVSRVEMGITLSDDEEDELLI